MAKALKAQLPPPGDQNDFEDLCEALIKEYWQDPTAEKFGTQGHEQYGIDIISPLAKEDGETRVLGIQCKKKKKNTGRKLTKADITTSLQKAENFTPSLSRLIVATTSSKDPKIQTHVATINISRHKTEQFPVSVWFWEDIEKLLQEKCPNTYLDYLIALFPEGSRITISGDLLKEALRAAEELVKDNYTERAQGVLSVFGRTISQLVDAEMELITNRLRAQLLIREEKIEEATELILEITHKNKLDIHSWGLLFDRYIKDSNLEKANETLHTLKGLDAQHPMTRNVELAYKLNANQEIEFPKNELTGTPREKATAYLVYHLYAQKKGDKEKRNLYLEKQRASFPNSPSPVYFDILYKVWDFFEDLKDITFTDVQSIWDFILQKEEELKTKNPIPLWQEINILLEKLRLDVLVFKKFRPGFQITASLKEEAISKIGKSYFDKQIYHILIQFLDLMLIDKQEISTIVGYLKNSRKQIRSRLGYLLLAQALLNDETFEYAETVCTELNLLPPKRFLDGLKGKELPILSSILADIHEELLHPLIAAIPDPKLALDVIRNLKGDYSPQTKTLFTHLKIFNLTRQEGGSSLDEIKREINFENQSFHLLNQVADYAQSRKLWDLETECLRHMLKFDLPDKQKAQFETQLAVSLFNLEDSSGVMERKTPILQLLDKLSEENQKVAIKVLVLSAIKTHQFPAALDILKATFWRVSDDFEFYYYKADLELKLQKYEDALSTILDGLRKKQPVSKKIYQACYIILNEIANAGFIPNQNEDAVTNDRYLKLSGIDSWFYLGNKQGIDAVNLEPSDSRYAATQGLSISAQIDWPPDQYQENPPKRTIEYIFAEPLYVRARAQEAFHKAAQEGSTSIWGVNAEDPEQGIRNMKKLWTQIQEQSENFFTTYVENFLPFSFLAKVEGGIGNAIGKLRSKQEGFININNGTPDIEQRQIQTANQALDGHPVFIDATSLLFLITANLHTLLSENIEHLYYTPSVSAYIREYASQYAQSPFQMGRISFGKNMEIIHSDYDHQQELQFKNSLLEAVMHFEKHAKKETSDFLSSKIIDIESDLPSAITDPFAAARAKKTNIISEDYFYPKALELLGGGNQPFPISSMAFIKTLYDRAKISWETYLDYVSLLLNHRCKHVTISPRIMQDAILVKNKSGLVTLQPQNIRKLHLDITLSTQYGVPPELASNVISGFLTLLIQDPAITLQTFKEIIAELFIQTLRGRDKRFGDSILSKCNPEIQGYGLIIPVTDRQEKFNIISSQINNYFSEFDPLYDSIPLLLARSS